MGRILIVQSVFIIVVLALFGCGSSNTSEENGNGSGEQKIHNESKQVDDFKVLINIENSDKDLTVYATITYMGDEVEKNIYHGGSIFFFNVIQQNGEFEYFGGMEQPLLTTTLIRNEPHRVNFNGIEKLKLKPGTYELEAIANFSLDSDDVVGTKIEIPVSEIVEIE